MLFCLAKKNNKIHTLLTKKTHLITSIRKIFKECDRLSQKLLSYKRFSDVKLIMKQQINILIEKDESVYSAYCSEVEGYKVTAKSLDIVIDNLKATIANYLDISIISSDSDNDQPIWQIAQDLMKDLTDEEKSVLPKDMAEEHDHYIYGSPKIN